MKAIGGRKLVDRAQITFPCNFDISQNPRSFCRQLERTKQALDAGFERELLAEIRRLKAVHCSPQIGGSLELGSDIDYLTDQLYTHFPHKYPKRTISHVQPMVTVGEPENVPVRRRKHSVKTLYLLWVLVAVTVLGFVVFLVWLEVK